uniref:VWFA domain-containing protein n=2 Tax=Odontella aurita TaxID=265563 RepID=A0A7S4NES1_9STRA|mmetsp:Transcript_60077/g.178135  ORF Transcript_60077/g.178135 Transcript_60077/m.178135 type:complete len:677 (+) Transcript_60077:86-2116(+)
MKPITTMNNKKTAIAGLALLSFARSSVGSTKQLEELFTKLESDVLDFRDKVEALYANRCDADSLDACKAASYDMCSSEYPFQTCRADEQLTIPACAEGSAGKCGGLFDYTTSTVRIPKDLADGMNGNPTDKTVVETVCYSRPLTDWMVGKYETDKTYWERLGVKEPQMYFGSHDGAFRIFPGRHSPECGTYDPRLRPWYIAGSSGPKNVVLVVDTSGSMGGGTGRKIKLLREAATLIVKTLTVADRISIVEFNTDAHSFPQNGMYVATEENKQKLIDGIGKLEANGQTNFYEAFDKAFDSLDQTARNEQVNRCNSAILFLTDGLMTPHLGGTEDNVKIMIRTRKAQYESLMGGNRPLFMFSFSINDQPGQDVNKLPKEIACETMNGIWSEIIDIDNIVSDMGSYYKLFALGLGESSNKNFVAWVEPYAFATGGNWGTTVSAPAFDRSVEPPLFLGVVGMDFTLATIDIALGREPGSSTKDVHPDTLKEIVDKSMAICPTLNLTQCTLQSYRKFGKSGEDAMCAGVMCSEGDFVDVEPKKCSGMSDYPSNLWANNLLQGKSYEDRVCCLEGERDPSNECPYHDFRTNSEAGNLSQGATVGIVIGAIAAGVCVLGCFVNHKRKNIEKKCSVGKSQTGVKEPECFDNEAAPVAMATPVIVPIPPPSNPAYSGASVPSYR